jgi:hypothetical protein
MAGTGITVEDPFATGPGGVKLFNPGPSYTKGFPDGLWPMAGVSAKAELAKASSTAMATAFTDTPRQLRPHSTRVMAESQRPGRGNPK